MERLVEEAITRFMPDLAAERAEKAAEGRHFDIHDEQVSFEGTVRVDGELDLADALDLEEAVSAEAEALRAAGSTDSLDVRRSQALGAISRHQLAFDLNCEVEAEARTSPAAGKQKKPRQVVLYVHLSEAAVHGVDGELHLARVENTRTFVTAEQVKSWCANPDAQVVVKQVVDLADNIHVEAYEAPKRLDEQTGLINHTCVFPWCTRPARKTDSEHPIPYAKGGTTSSDNQAPVCRRHHRLKTHSTWRYTMLEAGSYLWTSPHGFQFLRDHHGTLDVSADRRRPPRCVRPTGPVGAPPRTRRTTPPAGPQACPGASSGRRTGPRRRHSLRALGSATHGEVAQSVRAKDS